MVEISLEETRFFRMSDSFEIRNFERSLGLFLICSHLFVAHNNLFSIIFGWWYRQRAEQWWYYRLLGPPFLLSPIPRSLAR